MPEEPSFVDSRRLRFLVRKSEPFPRWLMVMRAVVAILTENWELQMIVGKRGFVPLPSGKLVLMPHAIGTTLYVHLMWRWVAFIVRWPRNVLPLA